MKSFLILALCSFLTLQIDAQFIAKFTGTGGANITFNAIQPYGDNYMLAGSEGNKILLAEMDPDGNILSSKTITVVDESTFPGVMSMIVDSDNKLVIVGYREFTVYTSVGFAIKYDYATSNINWIKIFNNPGSYFHHVIEKGAGGNYILVGQTYNPPHAEEGIIISIKRNTGAFTTLNNSDYNTTSETFYGITYTGSNYYVASRLTFAPSGATKLRGCLSKFDINGNELYTKAYLRNITTDNARLYAMDLTNFNGGLYMAIHGDELGSGVNKDLFLMRAKLTGAPSWIKKYDLTAHSSDGYWNSIQIDGGNVFACGNLNDLSPDNKGNVFILSTDTSGGVRWCNSYPFETAKDYNHPNAFIAHNGKLYVTGGQYNPATTFIEGVIMEVSETTGTLSGGCHTVEPVTIISKSKTTYSATLTPTANTYSIITPAKLQSITDVSNVDMYCDTINVRYIDLMENTINIAPNPTAAYVNIQLSEQGNYFIRLINMNGALIYESKLINESEAILNLTDYNAGIYSIILFDYFGNIIATEKIIKQSP